MIYISPLIQIQAFSYFQGKTIEAWKMQQKTKHAAFVWESSVYRKLQHIWMADSHGRARISVTAGLVAIEPSGGLTEMLLSYPGRLFHTVNNLPLHTWKTSGRRSKKRFWLGRDTEQQQYVFKLQSWEKEIPIAVLSDMGKRKKNTKSDPDAIIWLRRRTASTSS